MQLSALDHQGNLISARNAQRQYGYRCVECQGIVRLRGGRYRQSHFYHQATTAICRLNGKSLRHLNVQLHLEKLLPDGEVVLERPFPEISRIADVCWVAKRMIFEIQCSPITPEEVAARNSDYASVGYQVVWILHDARFNQHRQTVVEELLRSRWLYYTNIDREGRGKIYEQFSLYGNGRRLRSLAPQPVDLSKPHFLQDEESDHKQWPASLMQKALLPFCFAGDLIDVLRHDLTGREALKRFCEKGFSSRRMKRSLWQWIVRPYRIALRMLLEKLC
jgi:competence protein CoiA